MNHTRVKICGRRKPEILPVIEKHGIVVDDENPDIIICYGGDGTLVGAEREWPGVPKVALRDSRHCRTCSHHSNEEIIEHLAKGTLKTERALKLRVETAGQTMIALNDAILHNAQINSGIRFRLWIDDDEYTAGEIIGDGLVVASPFGSTAYHASITHGIFRRGIGIAFNNPTEPIRHLVVAEESRILVRITRGPAILACDNNPQMIPLEEGDEVRISRAEQDATLLVFDRVRYANRNMVY